MTPIAPPCIARVMAQQIPADQHFAFVRTPVWEQVEPDTKDGLRELIEAINEKCEKTVDILDLPGPFDELHEEHRRVMEADLAKSFAKEYEQGKADLSTVLCDMIERGQQVSPEQYDSAVARIRDYRALLDEIFDEYDAILTPATTGPGPAGLQATGSPTMNTIWTFCGTPAISVPLLQSSAGLPIGVQLVGARNDDARLFRSTRWLLDVLNA